MLPFQLWSALKWITIPGTIVGAYIILGIAAIGKEIENPFGTDANDLPLDDFCKALEEEIDIIASQEPPRPETFVEVDNNQVLAFGNYVELKGRSTEEIRAGLKARTKNFRKAQSKEKKVRKEEV